MKLQHCREISAALSRDFEIEEILKPMSKIGLNDKEIQKNVHFFGHFTYDYIRIFIFQKMSILDKNLSEKWPFYVRLY